MLRNYRRNVFIYDVLGDNRLSNIAKMIPKNIERIQVTSGLIIV